MATVLVNADAWDSLDPDERLAILSENNLPVMFGEPAEVELLGSRTYLFDDPRITEDQVLAVAVMFNG